MIDLDLERVSTETLHGWFASADDVMSRAVFRAVLAGRGEGVDWDQRIVMPIDEPVTVIASGREWDLPVGAEVEFTTNQTRVHIPVQWESTVLKADESGDVRYTMGAWYIPHSTDAHGEWTDPDTLQRAAWEYVRRGNRTIFLQHDRRVPAGELVEIMAVPQPVEFGKADGQKVSYPAGTVFAGVVWAEWAWPLVKAGHVRGLSIGGHAFRTTDTLPV